MKISILTLFPNMITAAVSESIVKRAQEKSAVTIQIVNIRDFALDEYGTVDDRPYGGGAGMVMRVEPIVKALQLVNPTGQNRIKDSNEKLGIKKEEVRSKVILTSARGTRYSQGKAQEYASLEHLVIIAGHYEGVDERISRYVDEEVSIGDFVMTGGEIAACAILDSVVRLLPNVLKKEEATAEESFSEVSVQELTDAVGATRELVALTTSNITKVRLLEYPQYTRPMEFDGHKVPEILVSGDHAAVRKWRLQQSYQLTKLRRPDLLDIPVI